MFRSIVVAASMLTLTSCSKPAVVGISGTVTYDGKPVPQGNIAFDPVELTKGQMRQTDIKNGEFQLPAEEGVVSGMEFKVVIRGFRKTGRKYPGAAEGFAEEVEQYLPVKYNGRSTLRVTPSPRGEENVLKFELSSK